MSLILDALKRSEQERANNRNNPAVNIDISGDVQHHKSHSPWLALLAILFVLALAVITYLLLRQTSDVPNSQPEYSASAVETVPTPVPPVMEEPVRLPTPAPEETFKEPEPTVKPPTALKPPSLYSQRKPKPVNPVPLSQQVAKPKVVKKPATKPPAPPVTEKQQAVVTPPSQQAPLADQPAEPATTAVEEQTTKDSVPVLSEIPDNDQMMFLNYEINTHFYSSKPGRSFALINMKKYRVGQFIDGSQMKITDITADGVVVNYGRGSVLLRSY